MLIFITPRIPGMVLYSGITSCYQLYVIHNYTLILRIENNPGIPGPIRLMNSGLPILWIWPSSLMLDLRPSHKNGIHYPEATPSIVSVYVIPSASPFVVLLLKRAYNQDDNGSVPE